MVVGFLKCAYLTTVCQSSVIKEIVFTERLIPKHLGTCVLSQDSWTEGDGKNGNVVGKRGRWSTWFLTARTMSILLTVVFSASSTWVSKAFLVFFFFFSVKGLVVNI